MEGKKDERGTSWWKKDEKREGEKDEEGGTRTRKKERGKGNGSLAGSGSVCSSRWEKSSGLQCCSNILSIFS